MPSEQPITAGQQATWLHYHRFRREGRCYRPTVRVLKVYKKTARIEARRLDGTVKTRFVKIDRLLPGARWG